MRRTPRGGTTPVATAVPVAGTPPIAVMRIDLEHAARVAPGSHAHDFPTLAYFERGAATGLTCGQPVAAGDLFVIAPGDVLTIGDPAAFAAAGGWCVHFLPEALDDAVPGALLSWRAHPLLCSFARYAGGGVLRLSVPAADRAAFAARIRALDAELHDRADGYREAALAHLVLLLVEVARLAGDAAPQWRAEPLLAEVFALIERRHAEPLSLRDVARALNLSPGHLTTTVRRRTGRTVGDWITERRMAHARRLLVETGMSVEEVGRAVGLPDPSYFARCFRRVHGLSPRGWRRGEHDARMVVGSGRR
ncbi:MAG: helix-turn-helix transcriptional regulator [Pseudonocardia sp.]